MPLPAPPPQSAPLPNTRTRVIRVYNQPASLLAWQLDPAHNPPPPGVLARPGRNAEIGEASKTASATPQLDALANAPKSIELRARWMQIDIEILAKELPEWNNLGATNWTRALPQIESLMIESLIAAGKVAPVTQQFVAFEGQPSILSYLPFRPIIEPSLREVPRSLKPSQNPNAPDGNRIFADPPYIPNIAATVPMLPYMAPMPGADAGANAGANAIAGTQENLPVGPEAATANSYVRSAPGGIEQMLGSRFQLTPALGADNNFILTLRKIDGLPAPALARITEGETTTLALPNVFSLGDGKARGLPAPVSARVTEGETAVFALPDVPSLKDGKVRRTFLLVEPRTVPLISRPALPVPEQNVPSQRTVPPLKPRATYDKIHPASSAARTASGRRRSFFNAPSGNNVLPCRQRSHLSILGEPS